MKFYEFGKTDAPVILLLPGTCCHWKSNFESVIPLLEKDFRVVCVSYDGFDETEASEFLDMLTETAKIEDYILTNYNGHIRAVYGCSLGGSFVGLLIQRGKVHIDHGILGSSDFDQDNGVSAKLKAWLIAKVLYGMFQKGKLPGFMQKRLEKKPAEERDYYEKMIDMFGMNSTRMAFVSKESIYNQFYSDLVTPIENDIFVPDTTVHCFFSVKMGEQYEERYRQHFKNPNICRHDLQHEELLICYPKQWVDEIKNCCESGN
ncbi:MAG: alpha/beta hydrolase [Acetobacter sp.]|nr:alpha/beta hydrolase [Bacteroides sp.]MCM1340129.1 alpha/beta hydrolase [Acetobacter sp.]MCM1432711.1 alpha/beta hydrolase [Clostridiales bacterium]